MSDSEQTIGFVGLGNMGSGMARNLATAGHSVKVFDLVPAAVQALLDSPAGNNISAASSAADAAANVDVFISMLPAGPKPSYRATEKSSVPPPDAFSRARSITWAGT